MNLEAISNSPIKTNAEIKDNLFVNDMHINHGYEPLVGIGLIGFIIGAVMVGKYLDNKLDEYISKHLNQKY